MPENNNNIIDIIPVVDDKISADKVRHMQEDIDYLDNQLSIASATVDKKDAQLEEQKVLINSLKKEVSILKDKLIKTQEGIIRFYQAM